MGTKEIIVGNPEGKVIVGTVDSVKAIGFPVGSFISAVHPFNHLLERMEFFRDSITVGKTNDLNDVEIESITVFMEELLVSQGIGTIAVSNEVEVPGKCFQMAAVLQ